MTRSPLLHIMTLVAFAAGLFGPLPAKADEFILPSPGVQVHISPPLNPPVLTGLKLNPENPFRIDFILDKGDNNLDDDQLKNESAQLIKYFLTSLTIPEGDLWVNLSPYEKNKVIPYNFGMTAMGRDLLAEDYMLKQITASLIYPEDEVGKKFWKRVYEEAAQKYGTTNIPVNTFNKVWIVPEKAVVYENAEQATAYVVESKLKVMLEEDYVSLNHSVINETQRETNTLGSKIVREIVLPQLTQEVNDNKNFVKLRQIYNSLILANWYRNKVKDSILNQVYADKSKIRGIDLDDPKEKERIYQRYVESFKKGVYNYIKEDTDIVQQRTIQRKYFSGGVDLMMSTSLEMKGVETVTNKTLNRSLLNTLRKSVLAIVAVGIMSISSDAKTPAKKSTTVSKKVANSKEISKPQTRQQINEGLRKELGEKLNALTKQPPKQTEQLPVKKIEQAEQNKQTITITSIATPQVQPMNQPAAQVEVTNQVQATQEVHASDSSFLVRRQEVIDALDVILTNGRHVKAYFTQDQVLERMKIDNIATLTRLLSDFYDKSTNFKKYMTFFECIETVFMNGFEETKFILDTKTNPKPGKYDIGTFQIRQTDIKMTLDEAKERPIEYFVKSLFIMDRYLGVAMEKKQEVENEYGSEIFEYFHFNEFEKKVSLFRAVFNNGENTKVNILGRIIVNANKGRKWRVNPAQSRTVAVAVHLVSGKKLDLFSDKVVLDEEKRKEATTRFLDILKRKRPYIDSFQLSKELDMVIKEEAIKSNKKNFDRSQLALDDVGGIDLTRSNMNIQIKNTNGEIKFQLNPEQLEALRKAAGFAPIIINIQPLNDLPQFLGLAPSENVAV